MKPLLNRSLNLLCASPLAIALVSHSRAQEEWNEYKTAKPEDAIARLQKKIDGKTLKLAYEPGRGYLRSLLRELRIDSASQVLVFSKTSLQFPFVSPRSPRAIYYDGECYVAWIPGAPVIEIIAIDPKLGPQFYTLANQRTPSPRLVRQTDDCLSCHGSSVTRDLPSFAARSVHAGPDGRVLTAAGSFVTTSASPLGERWGGWYVTGGSGSQMHMGNEPARGNEASPTLDRARGTNVTDLSRYFDTGGYLTPHSDIVSLMLLEQQMTIEDRITETAYRARGALRSADDKRALGWDPSDIEAGTRDRMARACEPLVRALLGADEPLFTAPIVPSNGFARKYALSAPADPKGRRLSELDLKTRILRYPCSPMVYSKGFRGLPTAAKEQVMRRLRDVLSGKDASIPLNGVLPERRLAALAILDATID
ncbi:MAG: hypothetical protein ACO1SV_07710 [Fimbriimonas sp.]